MTDRIDGVTTVTVATNAATFIKRGDYLRVYFGSAEQLTRVTSRVPADNCTTLTARATHRLRWVEWLRATWETWFLWPMVDG